MYEGCILVARLREKGQRRRALDPEHERVDDDTPSALDL
jgi:hypothetical protein